MITFVSERSMVYRYEFFFFKRETTYQGKDENKPTYNEAHNINNFLKGKQLIKEKIRISRPRMKHNIQNKVKFDEHIN